ncbi:MAG TPA: autorepressor SdpR family transcription factor [Gemmatimonadales bacterium]|jgi:DNA-binding transcriptional ArsR family regulator
MSDSAFRALADPTRRRILEMLGAGDRTAGQIAGEFSMAFASVSHHLRILRDAELVMARREGQNIHYRLNASVFQEVTRYLMKLFGGRK